MQAYARYLRTGACVQVKCAQARGPVDCLMFRGTERVARLRELREELAATTEAACTDPAHRVAADGLASTALSLWYFDATVNLNSFVFKTSDEDEFKLFVENVRVACAEHVERMIAVLELDTAARSVSIPTKRGRPADTDPARDARWSDAWGSGRYKTYADCAREFSTTGRDLKLALDRHRKRTKSAAE